MFFDDHFAAIAAICAGQVLGTRWHPVKLGLRTAERSGRRTLSGDALGVARAGFMEAGAPMRGPRF